MPKLRQRVDILGRTWRVHFVKKKLMHEGIECDGLTDPNKHLIQVSLNIDRQRQRIKLIHELGHAGIDATTGDHQTNECKCLATLESWLYHFLRNPVNKWALDFITESE
jgi:Zn-dependent peptidase ImmA (M78 family)